MFRVAVLVVAFNAEKKLMEVLRRIPDDLSEIALEVLVCDDASSDNTAQVGTTFAAQRLNRNIHIFTHKINLGYGGNQKFGYEWVLNRDFDAVVLLHGDGQYAPELIGELVEPLRNGTADAVLGSRMLTRGAARRGGMPLYKFIGNKILTRWQNFVTGTTLSEWHCGYRAYSIGGLRSINFLENSDGFDFDTQIILQLNSAGKRIHETPIPTYYGDEICYVQGIKYARQVATAVVKHRLKTMGFFASNVLNSEYRFKFDQHSSHGRIQSLLQSRAPGKVLDIGCAGGELSEFAAKIGNEVYGIDINSPQRHLEKVRFIQHDLEQPLPTEIDGKFQTVICADVLEHLRAPDKLLNQILSLVDERGIVLASVPNFGHWYPRLRVLFGKFDYDARGILDQSHLRFFTKKSFSKMASTAGYDIKRVWLTGTPFEVMLRGAPKRRFSWSGFLRSLTFIDRVLCRVRGTLFAYQFVFELRPKTSRDLD